jgi:outer membrane receptor protein involved in Fe transport
MNIAYTQSLGHTGTFKANVFASYYDFELYSNFTFFLNDSLNGDQIKQKEKRALAGYNTDYTTSYKIGSIKTSTQVGTGLRFDNSMNNELSHTLKQNTVLDQYALGDIYETNIFGYMNQVVYVTPRAGINAGTRFDQFIHSYKDKLVTETTPAKTVSVGAFSPKAGAFYNFANSGRLYVNYGTGFHSNDTRVVVAQQGREILPLARSYDAGIILKPFRKLLVSAAIWQLNMRQEFVYVGDEAVVELSGKTRRQGVDLSARYQVLNWLYADADVNYTYARAIEEPKGADYIPLAPAFTSIGGLTASFKNGISASLRYRYMGDRPANEDNSVVATGYNVFDAALNYTHRNYEFGTQVQNLFNTTWNEAQFDTETRLRNEATSVSEICFTPGTPFFIKLYAAYKF